jgi:hypothetical protein
MMKLCRQSQASLLHPSVPNSTGFESAAAPALLHFTYAANQAVGGLVKD